MTTSTPRQPTTPDLDRPLAALASAPSAVVALAEVPAVLGLPADAAAEALSALLAAGLVEVWEHPEAPALVLTPLGAGRAGVELEAPNDEATGRWVPIGEARPEPARRGRGTIRLESDAFGPSHPSGFDGLVDPRPAFPPDEPPRPRRALPAEPPRSRGDRRSARDLDRLLRAWRAEDDVPRPHTLVGLGRQWTTALRPPGLPCEGCSDRPLAPDEACLRCDRTGLDALLPQVPPSDRPKRYRPDDRGLSGGVGARKRPA